MKKTLLIFLCLLLLLLSSSCWDYRSVEEVTIVSGLAIDKDIDDEYYHITFEIIDLSSSPKDSLPQSTIVEIEANTFTEAIRTASQRLDKRLYMSNVQTVVISHQLAQEAGISGLVQYLLKDIEFRENIRLVISEDKPARDILTSKGITNGVISNLIVSAIKEDQKINASSKDVEIYQAFNALEEEGASLVLPVIKSVTNNEEDTVELSGLAAFREDKLVGFLNSEESRYYLFATDEIDGGVFSYQYEDSGEDFISMDIFHNKTKTSYDLSGEKPLIILDIETSVAVEKMEPDLDVFEPDVISILEAKAEAVLEQRIRDVLARSQKEFRTDIFCFGARIYKSDHKLWYEIRDQWDEMFCEAEFEINVDVSIRNFGNMK